MVHRVTKSQTQLKQRSMYTCIQTPVCTVDKDRSWAPFHTRLHDSYISDLEGCQHTPNIPTGSAFAFLRYWESSTDGLSTWECGLWGQIH